MGTAVQFVNNVRLELHCSKYVTVCLVREAKLVMPVSLLLWSYCFPSLH